MRNLIAFVVPELGITYEELYRELAEHVGVGFEEAARRFAPDEAVSAVHYHRRMDVRRQTFEALSDELGVEREVVFGACTSEGAGRLLEALRSRAAV